MNWNVSVGLKYFRTSKIDSFFSKSLALVSRNIISV